MSFKKGRPVIVSDNLESFCDDLLKTQKTGTWNIKDNEDASNFRVMPLNEEMEEFGRCLGRIFNLKLNSGFFQECDQNYRIKKHSHEGIMKEHQDVVYALLYTESEGDTSILSLYNENAEIGRVKGRLVLIPEDRYHSVEPSNGTNSFIRFVLVPRTPGERIEFNKKLMKNLQSNMSLYTV